MYSSKRRKKMKKRALIIGFCLIVSCFMFTANVSAAWYNCAVVQIVPWSDGEVRLQLQPGTNETAFSGTVRMTIDTTQPGGKNILATVLTAISLGAEITAESATVPAWSPIVECTGVGLVAP
jgi:hypothetical protein